MATLSSFFGSSGGGGAAGVASTFRVFYETGSMTVPSCAVFAAYGVMGGGATGNAGTSFDSGTCWCSGGGAGFSFKEAAQSCASNFTVCAIVGARGCVCLSNCRCLFSAAGPSCITGFSGGTICATGGGVNSCPRCPGMGYGGDINSQGGWGGVEANRLGGAGAGGLLGKGGDARASAGGGGFGSGGGGGAGCVVNVLTAQDGTCCCFTEGQAQGGAGGTDGGYANGGSGLSGRGGTGAGQYTGTVSGGSIGPEGGLIPQYTMCGYSQAKTFFSASGGGGGSDIMAYSTTSAGQSGAPGGGGGYGWSSAGAGGFGAGGAASECAQNNRAGNSGIGAGAAGLNSSGEARSGIPGQGIAVVEYWVTTS